MRKIVYFMAAGAALSAPVTAQDVDFSGTQLAACTIAIASPGVLGASADGTQLSSQEGAGTAGSITVTSVGANTVTVTAPTLTLSPVAYDGDGTLEVSYNGQAGLGGVSQSWTTSQTTFAVGTLPATSVLLNARIVDSGGFDAGNYTVRTVVTCS